MLQKTRQNTFSYTQRFLPSWIPAASVSTDMPTKDFAAGRHRRWPLVLLALFVVFAGSFLFYWFQLRPIHVYRGCAATASVDARALVKNKAELAQDPALKAQYQNLVDQNMYLRADYTSFLQKCLLHYGLPPVVTEEGAG
jgi:hypothetical protein